MDNKERRRRREGALFVCNAIQMLCVKFFSRESNERVVVKEQRKEGVGCEAKKWVASRPSLAG